MTLDGTWSSRDAKVVRRQACLEMQLDALPICVRAYVALSASTSRSSIGIVRQIAD